MSGKCNNCGFILRKTGKRKKTLQTEDEVRKYSVPQMKLLKVGDVLCHKCRLIPYAKSPATDDTRPGPSRINIETERRDILQFESADEEDYHYYDDNDEDEDFCTSHSSDEDTMILPLKRVISIHKYCILCSSKSNIKTIPKEARYQAFIKRRIFIPNGDRCCSQHLIKNKFFEDELSRLRIHSNYSVLSAKEVSTFLDLLSEKVEATLFKQIGDSTMPEEKLKVYTGLSWENIMELSNLLTSFKFSSSRNVIQALVIFLMKLRLGISNKMISSILQLEREQQVSDYCKQIIRSFEEDILPFHFGINSVSRQQLIQNHTTNISKALFNTTDDQLIIICDGTYIFHEKSTNNEYQRKSYSGQKKSHLCKPFTICATDGYIIDFAGPYYGTQNDATIMKIVLDDSLGLQTLLHQNDLIIADRGFRDVESYITKKGYKLLMPALKGKRDQLTTSEANESRKVTKVRWVVEAVHGAISQKFRLLDNVLDNKILPNVRSFCRIAAFLQNKYGKRHISDIDLHDKIIKNMKDRQTMKNTLVDEVLLHNWDRRKQPFQRLLASEVQDFPELSEEKLKILFTGTYQLSQAISYLAELMGKDNNFHVLYVKNEPNILKVQVQSRHINSKTYRCYIDYNPNGKSHEDIRRYCCNCANGNRTVGCCSHVAAIIYYLSNARYKSHIVRPAEILSSVFSINNDHVVINENSDDD